MIALLNDHTVYSFLSPDWPSHNDNIILINIILIILFLLLFYSLSHHISDYYNHLAMQPLGNGTTWQPNVLATQPLDNTTT